MEGGVKAPRIPIRDTELPCPLICAVAVEAAKTHATTQPRRTNFLQSITLYVFQRLKPPGFESCGTGKDKRYRRCYKCTAARTTAAINKTAEQLQLDELAPVLLSFQSRYHSHRSHESRHRVTGCDAWHIRLHCWPHSTRRTTGGRTAEHGNLIDSAMIPCTGALCKRARGQSSHRGGPVRRQGFRRAADESYLVSGTGLVGLT